MSETAANLPDAEPARDTHVRAGLSVVQTTGALLQVARQEAGLSVNDVSDQLKLSIRQINALENNLFDQLPTMVHVRGFVRSYAKLLKIDAEPLIALLPSQSSTPDLAQELRPSLDTPFMESRTSFLTRQDQPNRLYIGGALLLVLAAGAFVLFQKIERPVWMENLLSQNEAEISQEASAPVSDASIDVAAASQVVQNSEMGTASTLNLPNPVASGSASVAESNSFTASQATVAAPASAVATLKEVAPQVEAPQRSMNNDLVLKFTADSWLQVKTDSGKVLRSYLVRAGAEERIEVTEGLQVKLGNAVGVQAWLRGNTLDVTPPKDTNVSNFSVK